MALDKEPKPMAGQEIEEAEKHMFEVQGALALVEYVTAHKLGINSIGFLKRHDAVAHKLRNDSMKEWIGGGFADVFRRYVESTVGKAEMLALDTTDEQACVALFKKIDALRAELAEK